jgi:hypothetical protein
MPGDTVLVGRRRNLGLLLAVERWSIVGLVGCLKEGYILKDERIMVWKWFIVKELSTRFASQTYRDGRLAT